MRAHPNEMRPGRWLRIVALACSIGVTGPSMLSAQRLPARVEAGPNVRVSDSGVPHVELYVAAHPQNPQILIVTAIHMVSGQQGFIETFGTSDGGGTWSVSRLPPLPEVAGKETSGLMGDPAVAYAADGTVYCSMLAPMNRGHAWGRLPVLVYRSRDQGASWEGPAVAGPFFDRPAMVAAGTGANKRLFIAAMGIAAASAPSGIAVLRSDDDGASFRRTLLTPDNMGHNAVNPVVTPDGLLVVPYVDFPATSTARAEQLRQLLRTSRIYVVSSRDEGETFGLPRIVADIPRVSPGLPVSAVDLSAGKFRGRLYLAWNGGSGDQQNVTVAHSSDNGETWSPSVIKAPEAGPAYFSSVAVSNNGTLGVAWIQHASEESRRHCWRAYFAASVDGGENFSRPLAVSRADSCPDPAANYGNTRHPFTHGGDYVGLAAAADGVFHVVWPDCREGTFQVYATRVTVVLD